MISLKITKLPARTSKVEYGTRWLKQKKELMLKVQSVILPYEYDQKFNLILNPLHPDYKKIFVIEAHNFSFEGRLVKG